MKITGNTTRIPRFISIAQISSALLLLLSFASLAAAQDQAAWHEPYAPHRIADNLYYVGTRGLASYLVTTPEGNILINSSLEDSVPIIKANIEKLGFKFGDVKILLISHGHWDHDAGSATIKQMTGAKYAVMEQDVAVVESGGKADFHYGDVPSSQYKPARVDRVLHDGDVVTLGNAKLTAHLTAGHTKGCTTWTMKVTDGGKTYDVVILGSLSVNAGFKLVNNANYPQIAGDYEHAFEVLKGLHCDIFLGAHGDYYGMEAKVAKMKDANPGENVFIDPAGYQRYIAGRETGFRRELERQKK